jgi:parallel beta-helix repeat protein
MYQILPHKLLLLTLTQWVLKRRSSASDREEGKIVPGVPRRAIVVLILGASALLLLLALLSVTAGDAVAETIFVPDDHPTVQQAVDNATSGDIIRINDGVYSGNVDIDVPLALIGNGTGYTTLSAVTGNVLSLSGPDIMVRDLRIVGNVNGTGMMCVVMDDSTIESVEVVGCQYGIYLSNSQRNAMSDLDIRGCTVGLLLSAGSRDNAVRMAACTDGRTGLWLGSAASAGDEDNYFGSCNFDNNNVGAQVLRSALENEFLNCTFNRNAINGVVIEGLDNILTGCTANENDADGIVIMARTTVKDTHVKVLGNRGVSVLTASGTTLTSLQISWSHVGVMVSSSKDVTIEDCMFDRNDYGIRLAQRSTGCTVDGSSFIGIGIRGIDMYPGTDNLTVTGSKFTDTDLGIFCSDSVDLTVRDCTFTRCVDGAVVAERSYHARVIDCTITASSGSHGIWLSSSPAAVVLRCEISGSGGDGILVEGTAIAYVEVLSIADSDIHSNKGAGVRLRRCKYITVENSTVSSNVGRGIFGNRVSFGEVRGNTISANLEGVYLVLSEGCKVEDNLISKNKENGILLNESGAELYNSIIGNVISENSWRSDTSYAGIAMVGQKTMDNVVERNTLWSNDLGITFESLPGGCNGNVFRLNTVRNSEVAIWVRSGAGPNTFLLNNFQYNTDQAAGLHKWDIFDDGTLGNYWSDYSTKYPGAIAEGVVWSMPYRVLTGHFAVDSRPLVYPYEDDPPILDLGEDLVVTLGVEQSITVGVQDDSAVERFEWTVISPSSAEHTYVTSVRVLDFTFKTTGNFQVVVRAVDVWGLYASTSVNVKVIDDIPPVANAGKDILVNVGQEFTLSGAGSSDNHGIAIITWVVDPEGINRRSQGSILTLSIDVPGEYGATLSVLDYSGNTDSDAITITVEDLSPPVAVAGHDQQLNLGERATFDGSGSLDNVGIVEWSWAVTGEGMASHREGAIAHMTFDELGMFKVTLTVTDGAGRFDTDVLWVLVLDNEPPVAVASEDVAVPMDTWVTLSAEGSSDNVRIATFEWRFQYAKTTQSFTRKIFRFHFELPGVYVITLMVYDTSGNWAADTVEVVIVDNQEPEAKFWAPDEVELGSSLVLDGSGSLDNVGIVGYVWRVTHKGQTETQTGFMLGLELEEPGIYKVVLTVRDEHGNRDSLERSFYVPPKGTEPEAPGWLVPAMVATIAVAVLVGWIYARRRFGPEED